MDERQQLGICQKKAGADGGTGESFQEQQEPGFMVAQASSLPGYRKTGRLIGSRVSA